MSGDIGAVRFDHCCVVLSGVANTRSNSRVESENVNSVTCRRYVFHTRRSAHHINRLCISDVKFTWQSANARSTKPKIKDLLRLRSSTPIAQRKHPTDSRGHQYMLPTQHMQHDAAMSVCIALLHTMLYRTCGVTLYTDENILHIYWLYHVSIRKLTILKSSLCLVWFYVNCRYKCQ